MATHGLSDKQIKRLTRLIASGHFEVSTFEKPIQEPLLTLETLAVGIAVGPVIHYSDLGANLSISADQLPIIFCRSIRDIALRDLNKVSGVITTIGDHTSHVVLRAKGRLIPVARTNSPIDLVIVGTSSMRAVTLIADDISACIYEGKMPRPDAGVSHDLVDAAFVARDIRKLGVLANVDDHHDVRDAFSLGADGVSMWRTENFLSQLAEGELIKQALLDLLTQPSSAPGNAERDLVGLFVDELESILEIANGSPVVVRLLDLPLVELLGTEHHDKLPESARIAITTANPLLSIRGARLGITYPRIADLQLRAIVGAINKYRQNRASNVDLRLLVPLVSDKSEITWYRERFDSLLFQENRDIPNLNLRWGATIETPRSALIGFTLGTVCDFFSIGTNDLTQYTWALDRDSAQPTILNRYLEEGILQSSPFSSFDTLAVGILIKLAIEQGRASNSRLLVGITGGYGSDTSMIPFFSSLGVDYVGCPVRRVPSVSIAYAKFELSSPKA